jgi:ABC-type transporter Mla subunit MlaD
MAVRRQPRERLVIDHDRITERVNIATLKLELKRALKPLIVMAIGLAATAAAADYILTNINGGIGGTNSVQFEVADATGVVPGRAESRFYGIEAGLITNAEREHGHAVLTATIATKLGPIYRNAQAELRPNTALQDMYLDVTDRGTPSAGIAGPNDVIPMSQTQSPTNLADVLDLFQPDVRTQLNNILNDLGNGLQDRGADLRQAFIELAPLLTIAGNLSHQLADRATLTKQLVHNTAILSAVLASRSTQLHQLVTSGTSTLESLSTEGGVPLSETIDRLPATLAQIQSTLTGVDTLLPAVDHAIVNLTPVADRLPSGLTSLRALGISADPAMRKLETPVAKLLPLADQLQPFSNDLAGALQAIAPQVQDVNTATFAASHCTKQINQYMNWDASAMSKLSDSQGSMVRGNANFGFYADPTFKQSNFMAGTRCAPNTTTLGAVPTPKYDGPAPAP